MHDNSKICIFDHFVLEYGPKRGGIFMNIDINNRFVMICGPTTTGKTTLAYRIKKECSGNCVVISQDEIIKSFPKGISKNECIRLCKNEVLRSIGIALKDPNVDLVVYETVALTALNVLAIQMALPFLNYHEPMTLLKMSLPIGLHFEFCRERKRKLNEQPTERVFGNQLTAYYSQDGSLNAKFQNCEEFVITDPRNLGLDIRPRVKSFS